MAKDKDDKSTAKDDTSKDATKGAAGSDAIAKQNAEQVAAAEKSQDAAKKDDEAAKAAASTDAKKELAAGKSTNADDDQAETGIEDQDVGEDPAPVSAALGTEHAMHADLDSRPDAPKSGPSGNHGQSHGHKVKTIDRPLTSGADG